MVHMIILAQIPTPPSRVDCHLIFDFMTHLLMPSLLVESPLFPSASYYSNQWCYHRLSKYSGILLDRLKDWVNGEFKAKPTEVLLRFFCYSWKGKKPQASGGEAKIMMFKRKKSWICLCILLWMLRESSSLAREAANPARGREKWRCRVSAKKENVLTVLSHWFQSQKLESSLQHSHSYCYLFNFAA